MSSCRDDFCEGADTHEFESMGILESASIAKLAANR